MTDPVGVKVVDDEARIRRDRVEAGGGLRDDPVADTPQAPGDMALVAIPPDSVAGHVAVHRVRVDAGRAVLLAAGLHAGPAGQEGEAIQVVLRGMTIRPR